MRRIGHLSAFTATPKPLAIHGEVFRPAAGKPDVYPAYVTSVSQA
jgi:hypothetical protein